MILNGWQSIAEEMPMLSEYQEIFKEDASLQEILVKIFSDVLEFHWHAIKFFSGKGMTYSPRFSTNAANR